MHSSFLDRRRVYRLLLVAMGLALGLVIAEVGARMRSPNGFESLLTNPATIEPPGMFRSDRKAVTVPTPRWNGTVRTLEYTTAVRFNSLGLRGDELAPGAPQGLRILALGDSFTLGKQVEESQTWTVQLGQSLTDALGRPVEVLNAGVDGYGTAQAVARLDRLARPTRADAAILLFYAANDLYENCRYQKHAGPVGAESSTLEGGRHPLSPMRWSWLFATLETAMSTRSLREGHTPDTLSRYQGELGAFTENAENLAQCSEEPLDSFLRVCEARALRCLIALAPGAIQIHSDRFAPTLEAVDMDPTHATPERPHEEILQQMQGRVTIVDLLPPLQKIGQESALTFRFDGHWNADGHTAAAEHIHPALETLLREDDDSILGGSQIDLAPDADHR